MKHLKKVVVLEVKLGQVFFDNNLYPSPRQIYMKWAKTTYFPRDKVKLQQQDGWILLDDYRKTSVDTQETTSNMATQTESPSRVDASTQTESPSRVDASTQTEELIIPTSTSSSSPHPRTRLCLKWQGGIFCDERTCWYAHGDHLLGTFPIPPTPGVCHKFLRGNCPNTAFTCKFQH